MLSQARAAVHPVVNRVLYKPVLFICLHTNVLLIKAVHVMGLTLGLILGKHM